MGEGNRYLVTSALPYANGPLHVGHAIGAYVPADVYVRYRKLQGDDVLYICGTDEYGTPISVLADQEGVDPQVIVEKYHAMHADAFEKLGVDFDNFSGTARPIHNETAQEFFLTVQENGYLAEETVERPYCPDCDRFLPDRYVTGTCVHCGAEEQRGDQCEACGKQYESVEVKDPKCIICGGTPHAKPTTHWFFQLQEFEDQLTEWLSSKDDEKISPAFPDNARNFSLGWIREGLKPRGITRDMKWGIPVPGAKEDGKVLYVWFDAPIGYISSTKEWARDVVGDPNAWEPYWKDPATRMVHFIGKDNIPFHAIIFPAMLLAHGGFNLPWNVASNEYLNLEGKKMSTSRGWVVWLHDLLDEFQVDAIRYYLLSIAPETSDSDFSFDEFKGKVNNELIGTLGNFVNRTLTFIANKNGGIIPEGNPKWSDPTYLSQHPDELDDLDKGLINDIKSGCIDLRGEIERFKFKNALGGLLHYAQMGNQYFQKKEPWKGENETTLYLCANLCRSLAILMYPFLPFSAQEIWKVLYPGEKKGLKALIEGGELSWEDSGTLDESLAGKKIGSVAPLYKRIEDEDIASFKETYLSTSKEKTVSSPSPQKETTTSSPSPQRGKPKQDQSTQRKEESTMVEFEEFQKIELRIATIKEVNPHPNADKLLLLKVDVGDLGERQLVAGIKDAYTPDELVGRQIVVVANLKPAKLRGEESQGMLLAADVDGKAILLQPDKDVKPGTKIR